MLRLNRVWVDRVLERIHFELDRRPRLDYQPLPWLGVARADRDAGVVRGGKRCNRRSRRSR